MNLLVVESPSKIKAIEKYANAIGLDSYKVVATVGHLVDLPVNRMGVSMTDSALAMLPRKH